MIGISSTGNSVKFERAGFLVAKVENDNFVAESHLRVHFVVNHIGWQLDFATFTAAAPRLEIVPSVGTRNRLARSKAVFDVTLEDDAVGLGEAKSLIHGYKCVSFGRETRKNGGINWTSLIVNDGEGGPGILGHRHTASGENSVGRLVGNLNSEGESIANPYCFHFLVPSV